MFPSAPTEEEMFEAEQYFKRGNNKYFRTMLASKEDELDLLDESISDFTHAIKLNPNLSKYYVARGQSYSSKYNTKYKTSDLKKAIDDYEKALELNPNNRDIMKTLNELKNR